jgi:polyribonucleotide nucleotidyltransferase
VLDLADKLGALLGKGGMTIRNISEMSGARLDIDKETNTVTISGQPEEVCETFLSNVRFLGQGRP